MYRVPSTALAVVIYLVLPTANTGDGTMGKAKKEAVAKELRVPEGTWEVVSATVEGREPRFPKGRRPRLEGMEDRKAPAFFGRRCGRGLRHAAATRHIPFDRDRLSPAERA